MEGDTVGLACEEHPGHPLLQTVMANGRRIGPAPSLSEVRKFCRLQLSALPDAIGRLDGEERYPVSISESLRSLARQSDELVS